MAGDPRAAATVQLPVHRGGADVGCCSSIVVVHRRDQSARLDSDSEDGFILYTAGVLGAARSACSRRASCGWDWSNAGSGGSTPPWPTSACSSLARYFDLFSNFAQTGAVFAGAGLLLLALAFAPGTRTPRAPRRAWAARPRPAVARGESDLDRLKQHRQARCCSPPLVAIQALLHRSGSSFARSSGSCGGARDRTWSRRPVDPRDPICEVIS